MIASAPLARMNEEERGFLIGSPAQLLLTAGGGLGGAGRGGGSQRGAGPTGLPRRADSGGNGRVQ